MSPEPKRRTAVSYHRALFLETTMRAVLLFSALLLIPMTSRAGAPNKTRVLLNEMRSDRLDIVIAAGEQLMAQPPRTIAKKLRVKAGLQLAEAYEKTADFGR